MAEELQLAYLCSALERRPKRRDERAVLAARIQASREELSRYLDAMLLSGRYGLRKRGEKLEVLVEHYQEPPKGYFFNLKTGSLERTISSRGRCAAVHDFSWMDGIGRQLLCLFLLAGLVAGMACLGRAGMKLVTERVEQVRQLSEY